MLRIWALTLVLELELVIFSSITPFIYFQAGQLLVLNLVFL